MKKFFTGAETGHISENLQVLFIYLFILFIYQAMKT